MSDDKINDDTSENIDNIDNIENNDDLIIDGVEDIAEPNPDEKVGDIIKRGRVSRRISIESLSSSLKFSAVYIKAIEESRYKDLPGLPYAKVYIKTISEYLSLDSDAILKEFMREVDGDNIESDNINKDTITIRVQDDKKTSHLIPIISVIAIVILLILLVSNNDDSVNIIDEANINTIDSALIIDEIADTLDTTALPQDSLTNDSAKVDSTNTTATIDNKKVSELAKADSTTIEKKKLELTLTTVRDSSWITVFTDGKKVQQGLIYHPKTITFTALDSINIKLGAKEAVIMLLNNRPLPIRGTGLKMLALRSNGKVEYWRTSRWKSTFTENL